MSDYDYVIEERREKVFRMTKYEGATSEEIARTLNVSTRTVMRDRKVLGISRSPVHQYPQEIRDKALELLKEGVPYEEVHRTLGPVPWTLKQWHPGYSWTPQECSWLGNAVKVDPRYRLKTGGK